MGVKKKSEFEGLRVLVFDGYGRQIPTILEQLHELGCTITTVNDSKLDIGYCSRYPSSKVLVPGIKEDEDLLQKTIDDLIPSGNYDVAFPMLEKATNILTKNAEFYRHYVKIIAAPYTAFISAYNKQATMETCMRIGTPCPRTKRDDETLDEYLTHVHFPLAVKPRKGTGSIGFACVKDEQTLRELIATEHLKVNEYVIQEYISDFKELFAVYLLLDQNGGVKTAVSGRTLRWFPTDGGPGCFLKCEYNQEIIDCSVRLLKELHWVGFAYLSYIIDPLDHQPKLMEINGRIPAGVKICNLVGGKTVLQLLQLAYGMEVTDYSGCRKDGVCLRYFHTDIMWLLKSKNRFRAKPSWFNFIRNHDYIFSWKDPIPFFSYGISHFLNLRKDMGKRDRNL